LTLYLPIGASVAGTASDPVSRMIRKKFRRKKGVVQGRGGKSRSDNNNWKSTR